MHLARRSLYQSLSQL